jgi:CheY-like chemotaxis protein
VKILVAEDNVMNQVRKVKNANFQLEKRVIMRMLKSIGYNNVRIVDNGQKAIEAVSSDYYKIVLMDCMMPITSGKLAVTMPLTRKVSKPRK